MSAPNITRWIGIGLLGLPLYGVLTFFSSLNSQPDPDTHLEAWARYVTTDSYVLTHLFLSDIGLILAIFGTFTLGAYLAASHAGRMGLVAMVMTVFGSALFLTIGGVTTFAAPEEGQAVLVGLEEFESLPTIFANTALMATYAVCVLLMLVGNVLLGVAVWRSGTLPKWAGALWVVGSALPLLGTIYALVLDTQRTPPTVPMGAVLLVIGGAWIAWSVLRRPSAAAAAVGVGAHPRVQ
jgi:uncharacterized membrane protein YgdD (TMEM256/DUF423 family)